MDMTVFKLTDEAKNQMTKMLEKNPGNYAVGLAVLGGGCAGFKYDWQLIKNKEEVSKDDATVEWEGGRFVVDEISLLYVSGTTIDWKEELFGSQFTVENPNATSGCGCGESFGI